MQAVVSVDIGSRPGKAVAALMSDDGSRLRIEEFVVGDGDHRRFAERVVELAKSARAAVVVESQFIRHPQAAIALIEARMWIKVLAALAGVEYSEAHASTWQSVILRMSKTPKRKGNTKERASEAARRIWPCLEMNEDHTDAVLIGLWWLRFRGARNSRSPSARCSRSRPRS
ncbi:MAG TPA: hypothetical protein PKA64_06115 [Myxococcota bacterium]|nr:hypothetical protein [Myxococcota bacterium]